MSYLNSLNILTRHARGQDKKCELATGAAIAIGAASLLGSLVSAGSSAYNAAQGRAYSNEQIKYLANHDRLMQLYDQIYNDKITDPSYIKAQYEKAGLNPSLMMEGGTSIGSASGNSGVSASAPPVADYTPAINMATQGMAGAINTYLNAQQVDADTRLTNAQGVSQEISNEYERTKIALSIGQQMVDIDNALRAGGLTDEQTKYYKQMRDNLQQEYDKIDGQWNELINTPRVSNEAQKASAALMRAQAESENTFRELKRQNLIKEGVTSDAIAAQAYASAANLAEQKNLTKAQYQTELQKSAREALINFGAPKNISENSPLLRQMEAQIDNLYRYQTSHNFGVLGVSGGATITHSYDKSTGKYKTSQ